MVRADKGSAEVIAIPLICVFVALEALVLTYVRAWWVSRSAPRAGTQRVFFARATLGVEEDLGLDLKGWSGMNRDVHDQIRESAGTN